MTRSEYGCAYEAGFRVTISFLASKGAPLDEAEEIAQAAWTKGWERIDQLRHQQLVRTWVNTIALNIYRREAQLDSRSQPLVDSWRLADVNEAAIDLSRLLESCCSSDRALLKYQLDGLTTSEIARVLGASEIAIRLRLMRARRSVRSINQSRKPNKKAA